MKQIAFAIALSALGVAASTPASADYTAIARSGTTAATIPRVPAGASSQSVCRRGPPPCLPWILRALRTFVRSLACLIADLPTHGRSTAGRANDARPAPIREQACQFDE